MNEEQQNLIKRAIAGLKLKDIFLYQSRFMRPEEPSANQTQGLKQDKKGSQFVVEADPENDSKKLFRVLVTLGTRIVNEKEDEDEEDVEVYFYIEADFVVEYELLHEVDEDALKVFADYNSIHNVWPFWRQHVFDIVQRSRLPHLDIPLFS